MTLGESDPSCPPSYQPKARGCRCGCTASLAACAVAAAPHSGFLCRAGVLACIPCVQMHREIRPKTLQSILNQADITLEELLENLYQSLRKFVPEPPLGGARPSPSPREARAGRGVPYHFVYGLAVAERLLSPALSSSVPNGGEGDGGCGADGTNFHED